MNVGLALLCGGCAVIHDFRLPLFDLFVCLFLTSVNGMKRLQRIFFLHAWLHVSSLLYSTSGQMYLFNMSFNEIEA